MTYHVQMRLSEIELSKVHQQIEDRLEHESDVPIELTGMVRMDDGEPEPIVVYLFREDG